MYFLREHFQIILKCIFWGNRFENIFEMYFLKMYFFNKKKNIGKKKLEKKIGKRIKEKWKNWKKKLSSKTNLKKKNKIRIKNFWESRQKKKSKENLLRRNWMLEQSYWLVKNPVFYFNLLFWTQSVNTCLVPYHSLYSACMTYKTPYHAFGHQVCPTQPLPRHAEDFPRGGKYTKNVPLPT